MADDDDLLHESAPPHINGKSSHVIDKYGKAKALLSSFFSEGLRSPLSLEEPTCPDALYTVIQDYASVDASSRLMTREGQITHPRDDSIKWSPSKCTHLSTLDPFNVWLKTNISNYMATRNMWKCVGPNRFLYSYGPRGSGRSTAIASFCAVNKINLHYIRNEFYKPGQLMKIFEYAKTKQPCVVYFDGADRLAKKPAALEHMYAAMSLHLNSVTSNVWVVMSTAVSPVEALAAGTRISEHVVEHGTAVSTPALCSTREIRELLDVFFLRLTQTEGFCDMEGSWVKVIQSIVNKSVYHTPNEIMMFLSAIFRDHLSKISETYVEEGRTSGSLTVPSIFDFDNHMKNLPRENNKPRLTSFRCPERDFTVHVEQWNMYTKLHNLRKEDHVERFPPLPGLASPEGYGSGDEDLRFISSPSRGKRDRSDDHHRRAENPYSAEYDSKRHRHHDSYASSSSSSSESQSYSGSSSKRSESHTSEPTYRRPLRHQHDNDDRPRRREHEMYDPEEPSYRDHYTNRGHQKHSEVLSVPSHSEVHYQALPFFQSKHNNQDSRTVHIPRNPSSSYQR